MEVTLGLAQLRRKNGVSELDQVADYCQQAADAGVDILTFPEMLMTPFGLPTEEFARCAQPVNGEFPSAVNALAAKHGLWIVYTMNEKNPAGHPFNTLVLVGPDGVRRRAYRKTHLFDADFTKESEKMSVGDSLMEPVDSEFGKLGAAICYDLRFPEVAQFASLRGADFMFYPSAWYDGDGKLEQWRALLTSRAIENQVFVVGTCRCENTCVGHSLVAAPNGKLIAEADREEQLLVCKVDTDLLEDVRTAFPIMTHRRPELYRAPARSFQGSGLTGALPAVKPHQNPGLTSSLPVVRPNQNPGLTSSFRL